LLGLLATLHERLTNRRRQCGGQRLRREFPSRNPFEAGAQTLQFLGSHLGETVGDRALEPGIGGESGQHRR
jgi:hypothetical protein